MSRLTPVSCHKLVCVFEQPGYRRAGPSGSHIKLERPGVARPLIIPRYDDVGPDIILSLLRTAGITRQAYLTLLGNC